MSDWERHDDVISQLAELAAQARAVITELIGLGQVDAASDLLAKHEALLQSEELFCIKGVLGILRGEPEEAERHLLAGFRVNPNDPDLIFNLAYLCQTRGQIPNALALYRRALNLADAEELRLDARARIEQLTRACVRCLSARPDYSRWRSRFTTVLPEASDEGSAPVYCGEACLDTGARCEALACGSDHKAAEVIGDLFQGAGDSDAAATWYTEALKADPLDEAVFAKLLAVLVLHRSHRETIGLLESVYGDDPGSLAFLVDQCARLGHQVLREHFQYSLDTRGAVVKPCQVSTPGERPKVAVLIPTYNQQGYLRQAVESVLAQDCPNLEVIVADDHSTDGTEEMMSAYRADPRVRYLRNRKNLGPGNNSRNALYHETDAEYVMILNHDDYLVRDDYLSTAVDFLRRHETASFVWANCYIQNTADGKSTATEFRLDPLTRGTDYFLNYETGRYVHITGVLTTVFRRERALRMNCMTEMSKSKDLFLYLKLMLTGDVGFIDERVSVYRVHSESISNNMPLAFDYSTLEEFEELRLLALRLGFRQSQLKTWVDTRVRAYVGWRFRALWLKGLKREALKLLWTVSRRYPDAYESLVGSL